MYDKARHYHRIHGRVNNTVDCNVPEWILLSFAHLHVLPTPLVSQQHPVLSDQEMENHEWCRPWYCVHEQNAVLKRNRNRIRNTRHREGRNNNSHPLVLRAQHARHKDPGLRRSIWNITLASQPRNIRSPSRYSSPLCNIPCLLRIQWSFWSLDYRPSVIRTCQEDGLCAVH